MQSFLHTTVTAPVAALLCGGTFYAGFRFKGWLLDVTNRCLEQQLIHQSAYGDEKVCDAPARLHARTYARAQWPAKTVNTQGQRGTEACILVHHKCSVRGRSSFFGPEETTQMSSPLEAACRCSCKADAGRGFRRFMCLQWSKGTAGNRRAQNGFASPCLCNFCRKHCGSRLEFPTG